MASRRLRRLKAYSFRARRRKIWLDGKERWKAAKRPEGTRAAQVTLATRCSRQCDEAQALQAQVKAEVAYALALEEEMQQLKALDEQGEPSSSYEEEEGHEESDDEDTAGSEFSDDESSVCCPTRSTGNDAEHAGVPTYGGGAEYWNLKHLEDKNPYEWMQGYSDLSNLISRCTARDKELRVLHVGCGSSLLTEEMYDDGYSNIVNIDISSVVVERMRERNSEARPTMQWLVMDATAMGFENGVFDMVLDKCTIVMLVCCTESKVVVGKYLKEVAQGEASPQLPS
eukprot:gnl/TRDRNA2_/TRDRNA2_170905_c0_seq2.p1 gnl/TRDRNA2_/TRDRNA2_170905_c0~~gnl/TRDRNA2_/TRDRNA2_170905_c0_seq2.p1  ORF type:complete len:285 (+),score=51.82 gnl/TRDRNA2_/TRDRNA2_170905_c0_seq2:49-903(+)